MDTDTDDIYATRRRSTGATVGICVDAHSPPHVRVTETINALYLDAGDTTWLTFPGVHQGDPDSYETAAEWCDQLADAARELAGRLRGRAGEAGQT
jgi:predicted transcriptional regulator